MPLQFSSYPGQNSYEGMIVNTATGEVIVKPVNLNWIIYCRTGKRNSDIYKNGKLSKEIAAELSISLHTVNRHRQNILEKASCKQFF